MRTGTFLKQDYWRTACLCPKETSRVCSIFTVIFSEILNDSKFGTILIFDAKSRRGERPLFHSSGFRPHNYPGCQRLFKRGFRFRSSLRRSCLRPKAEDVSACGRQSSSSHARKNQYLTTDIWLQRIFRYATKFLMTPMIFNCILVHVFILLCSINLSWYF